MNKSYFIRNICIGLIDGLIIPLALAAGLSSLVNSSVTIIIACMAAAVAGAITMSIGGFIEARKYEPSRPPAGSALTIGLGYLAGGAIVCLPYYLHTEPLNALQSSATVSLLLLLIAGYIESAIHGSKGWTGALRVFFTGIVAATAAFLIAKLVE